MRELEIEKAIFVGHDLGGGVAQIAAVRDPGLCAGLFLTNAIGYDSWPIPSVSAMKASAGLVRHLPDPVFKALLSSLFYRGHDDPAKAKNACRTHIPSYLAHRGAASLIAQVEQLHTADTLAVADQLPMLRIPARIVWGASINFRSWNTASDLPAI
jgi:pimeloyl-ACP methyl ester carboxylesterase